MTPGQRRAALVAVLGLAAALRCARLDHQGLLLFDEGQLIFEAREATALARHALGTLAGRPGAREALAARIRGCPIIFARPVHNAALAAVLLAAPGMRADQATFMVSAAAGTATVAAIAWLGATWFGPGTGILAALLLAVAPYHLLYSREGLSDALAVCWWILALACTVYRGRASGGRRMALLAGLLAGLCLGTNYRSLFLPLVVLPILIWNRGLRAILPWSVGFAVPLLACEGVYHAVAWIARVPASAFGNGTYVDQLRYLILLHGRQEFPWRGFPAFPYYVHRWEGLGALLLLLPAVLIQVTRWRGPDAALNLAWLTPWILYSAYWDNASRFFVVLLPLVALVKARWIVAAGRSVAWQRLATASAGLLAASVTIPAVLDVVPRPTPYLEAARFMAQAGDVRHLSTNSRVGLAYFGEGAATPIPPTPDEVKTDARLGWRWAVTDLQVMFGGFDRPDDRFATAVWIANHRATAFTAPYSSIALTQGVLEQDVLFTESLVRLKDLEAHSPRLHVIDLTKDKRKAIRDSDKGQQ